MIGENLRHWFKDFWAEYRKNRSGMVGLALLLLFVAAIAFEPLLIPYSETNSRWRDITYWDDNPENAPPAWTNWFSARKAATQLFIRDGERTVEETEGARIVKTTFAYDFSFDLPPIDVIGRLTASGTVPLIFSVRRPDGTEIELYKDLLTAGDKENVRISVSRNAAAPLLEFARGSETEQNAESSDVDRLKTVAILFAEAREGMLADPEPLKGRYVFTITTLILGEDMKAGIPTS